MPFQASPVLHRKNNICSVLSAVSWVWLFFLYIFIAAKTAMNLFAHMPEATQREKELMKACTDPELVAAIIGNVKVTAAGLTQLKQKQKKGKKNNSKEKSWQAVKGMIITREEKLSWMIFNFSEEILSRSYQQWIFSRCYIVEKVETTWAFWKLQFWGYLRNILLCNSLLY